MSAEEAPLSPVHALAQHFAERAVTWAREREAPADSLDALREAAHRTSLATAGGHVCMRLCDVEWPGGHAASTVRKRLLESRVVGTARDPSNFPLVLDDDDRLYLHRYFDYERRLARCLMARVTTSPDRMPPGLSAQLDALFADKAATHGDRIDWQRVAVALAMLRRLVIVSGGPGTGKTTAVVKLLACLLGVHPECRIALAAPTGKAAARMMEAIRSRIPELPGAIGERFPTEAFTLHRLLGASAGGRFRYHGSNPLAIDVLVVDEASMLDLALAVHLFEALPAHARVVMLGDKDQLAAVEAGAVFAEICADPSLSDEMRATLARATGIGVERIVAPASRQPVPLRDCAVWFSENYRFAGDSGIRRLAAFVNAGDAEKTLECVRNVDSSVTWLDDGARLPAAPTMDRARGGYREYLDAVRAHSTASTILETFGRFRVLCAEREGSRGVSGMNAALSHWFRGALDHPLDPGARSPWYPGRPIMVMRNDYALHLYNGDVGVVLPTNEGRLLVFFPDAASGFRGIPPARLPEHETAFATTVHKAQGSEFDAAMLMLPAQATLVVTRELLYTGITRARRHVTLAADATTLGGGVARRVERASGLLARLAEAR